jgi:hypothetical protein
MNFIDKNSCLYTWVLVHDLFDFYTIVQTFVKKVQGCSVKNTYGRIIEHSLLSRTDSLFLETCILSYEPDILIVIYFWTMEGLYCYANHKNIAS